MTLFRLSLIRTPRQVAHRYLTTLGIRREDPNRIWERRVPLTPEDVQDLVKEGKDVAVEVESCKRRCFPDMLYSQAGATVVPSLTKNVDVVLGIKEPPVAEVEKLLRKEEGKKRAWMVFSHTHKGQRYNTELLSTFMDKHQSQSLIDHELLTAPTSDGSLKRVAAFGWYAGAVGAGESLSMTGLALLQRGIATPLLNLPRPYTFPSLDEYKAGLGAAGEAIRNGPPVPSGPIVIGLTGAGNVSQGAKAMLDALGVEWLKPEDLTAINERDATKLYACAVPPNAYFARGDGTYSRDDYYASPSSYTSTFATKIAPYLTTLINGAGWKADFPRVMTDEDIEGLIQRSHGAPKLAAVQDVTCDLKGNLEFIDRHTTIDEPHFKGPGGILISAVDILPTELAKDASKHFSKCLLPYIRHISNTTSTDKVAQETLDRATIVRAGALTADHQWLQPRVDELRGGSSAADTPAGQARQQQVLLLGSGLVAGPAVEVFAARSDVRLVIGSNNVTEAQALVRDRENVQALGLDVGDAEALSRAVSESDVVVSLLPAPMHVKVAQHCISHGKHLVTASYISPEMKELSDKAEQSDIVILGECGLDPGIDSMAAMRIMDRVKREGKKVTSFVSWCGGLPEPAASNVPLGYKFSWSPKAVLTAAQNDAKFKLGGEMRTIPGQDLLKEHFGSVNLWKGLSLEGLANRDSLPYAEKYGLGPVEELRDVFRGTLRYKGFSEVLDAFRQMGLLSTEPLATQPQSWDELLVVSQGHISSGPATAQESLAQEAKDALHSLFDSASTVPFPQLTNAAPIDYFAALLSHQLAYLPHERDSALLHHAFKLKAPGDVKEQNVTASLLCYGTDEGSAMSITVGKTLAFAALRVLDGHVKGRGVKGPYEREVWEGVLQSLEEVGVRVEEKWD